MWLRRVRVNRKKNLTEIWKAKCSRSQASVQGQVLLLLCLPGWLPGWCGAAARIVSGFLLSPPLCSFRFSESCRGLCGEGCLFSCMSHTASGMEVMRETRVPVGFHKFHFVLTASSLFLLSPTLYSYFLLITCPSFCLQAQH